MGGVSTFFIKWPHEWRIFLLLLIEIELNKLNSTNNKIQPGRANIMIDRRSYIKGNFQPCQTLHQHFWFLKQYKGSEISFQTICYGVRVSIQGKHFKRSHHHLLKQVDDLLFREVHGAVVKQGLRNRQFGLGGQGIRWVLYEGLFLLHPCFPEAGNTITLK